MPALTEGKHTGEFILSEAEGKRSRDTVTVIVPDGATLAPGTVLGKLTSAPSEIEGDAYAPFDDSAHDGTETAAGILYGELVNPDDSNPANLVGVIVDADAEVRKADLVWGDGADDAQGVADLLDLGIKARD